MAKVDGYELDNCRFCGSDDVHFNEWDMWKFVACWECKASGPTDLGISGAAELWNKHPQEAILRAELEQARARIAELEARPNAMMTPRTNQWKVKDVKNEKI